MSEHSMPGGNTPPRRRRLTLISYEEALGRLSRRFSRLRLPTEYIAVSEGLGRLSASTVRSSSSVPSSRISAMDGYGIRAVSTKRATASSPAVFVIKKPTRSGHRTRWSVSEGEAVSLLTGSAIPRGVDAVVRLEDARPSVDGILIDAPVPTGKNVEHRGEDVAFGRGLVRQGDELTPARISLLLGAGIKKVKVFRKARVAILSVGQELVTLDERANVGGTVNNYAHLLAGYISEFGATPVQLGVASDERSDLSFSVRKGLGAAEMLVTIGRASMGPADHSTEAISSLPGAEVVFHGIAMLPVRPTGLAVVRGKPVCILPAKAISTALSFFLVAVPILNLMNGLSVESRPPTVHALTLEPFANWHGADTLFLVNLFDDGRALRAKPLRWGSNLSSELGEATGFVSMRKNQRVRKGEPIAVSVFSPSLLRGAGESRSN